MPWLMCPDNLLQVHLLLLAFSVPNQTGFSWDTELCSGDLPKFPHISMIVVSYYNGKHASNFLLCKITQVMALFSRVLHMIVMGSLFSSTLF